jgi:hypothetical protein
MSERAYFTCDDCHTLTPQEEIRNPLVGKAQIRGIDGGVAVAPAIKVCRECAKLPKYAR